MSYDSIKCSSLMMISTTRPQGAGKQMAKTLILRCSVNSLISLLFAFVFVAVYWAGERRLWVFEDEEGQATTKRNSLAKCNLFSGKWVFDNKSYPLYKEKECTFMWDEFACEKFGRKDLNYQSWRWQPHQCDLPRFNATALLEKLRGKRMVFVGDSLNRDQWVSMVCLVESTIPAALKSKQFIGNLVQFKAIEYNASIDFYWSPLLVESNSDDPARPRLSERIVRISEIEKHARHWTNADILILNSYMWWRFPKTKLLWGSFESLDKITKEVNMLQSYEMAIRTLSDWLNIHVDRNKTRSFFMSMSPTHLRGQEWGMSKPDNCYNETMPITKEDYWGSGSDMRMMKIVEAALDELREKGLQIEMLNITQLSEYRKEAHPSIHKREWRPLTEAQLSNPQSYSDCVHWCLPGVPDVWNEILYAYIFNLT